MLNRIAACALLLPCAGIILRAQTAPQFTISTVAGDGTAGYSGDNGQAIVAMLNNPAAVTLDTAGDFFIADKFNHTIRKVALDGTITTVAGTGQQGYSGDGGLATNAQLFRPNAIALDSSGNLYIADQFNNVIRKVSVSGIITTVAGSVQGYCGDGGPAIDACLNGPVDVAIDAAGNLYIAEFGNNDVRKVDTNGIITTIAGNHTQGYSGDGGPATAAELNGPGCVTLSPTGDIFVCDQGNERIRKVSGGIITTFAGNGTAGYSGDGGPATSAQLSGPGCARLDRSRNLYIADGVNERFREVLVDGTIVTVAGNGTGIFSGDGGPALNAGFNPTGFTISTSDSIYFADRSNNRVRLLTPALQPPSIGAGGVVSASAFGEFTTISPGSWIEIYGANLAVDTRGWTGADFTGINAPISLDGTSVTIGGESAFVDFISPGQVNVLVPSDVPTGEQQLIVTTPYGPSAAYDITVNTVEPGLLAPANFSIGGTQYVVALFADYSYALPTGAINGLASRPAKPGDTIVLYGIGFGPVSPAIPAGQLVQQANSLAFGFEISIGGVQCQIQYDGLAPNYTGLYQFNIVVPDVAAGNQPLTFTVDGVNGTQTLYVAVGN